MTSWKVTRIHPKAKVAEYIRLKKGAISHVRFVMDRDLPASDPDRVVVERALKNGDIEAAGPLGVGDASGEQGLTEMTELADVQLLFRAHWAILIDEPQTAAAHFVVVASRRGRTDAKSARHLLADGGDHLSRFGCVQGKDWLNSAVSLYESSLRRWSREEEEVERAITQNNLGAILLLLGAKYVEGEEAAEVLGASVESLRDAAGVLVSTWEPPDPRVSIVYGNLAKAIDELVRAVGGSSELEEVRAARLETGAGSRVAVSRFEPHAGFDVWRMGIRGQLGCDRHGDADRAGKGIDGGARAWCSNR